MEQTAVNWLKEQLPSLFEHDERGFYKNIFEQAKEMEKQQRKMIAWNAWYNADFSFSKDEAGFNKWYEEFFNIED